VVASFAGLDFELSGDAVACDRIVKAAPPRAPGGAGLTVGTSPRVPANALAPKFAARCRLHMLSSAGAERTILPRSGITWHWGEGGGQVVTRFAHAHISGGVSGFYGRAWVDDDALAPHFLLSGLTALLAHRLGGAVLHAASVELDAGVIAFIGPSGAGKSTACCHVAHAPLFSVDRLAIVPLGLAGSAEAGSPEAGSSEAGPMWLSHPLPGGTRPVPDMPSAEPRWLPVAGILRVERSAADTTIGVPSLAGAVRSLRESTFQAGVGPGVEAELLGILEHLAQRVPVARLHLNLGASLGPLLSRWLVDQAEERR
jgi:hypothetical protein